MAHDLSQASRWLALSVQGDIGPITFYTSARGKAVSFPRVPPLHPPSPIQEVVRVRFQQAAAQWHTLSKAERDAWLTTADKCNLGITGWNLYTWFAIKQDFASLAVLQRKTGITLALPTKV